MNKKFNPHVEMTDEEVEAFLKEQQFIQVRKMEDGEWIGILALAYSLSVCTGITYLSAFQYRWCFDNKMSALEFYTEAKTLKDIPNEDLQHDLVGHRHTSAPLLVLYDKNGFPRWR